MRQEKRKAESEYGRGLEAAEASAEAEAPNSCNRSQLFSRHCHEEVPSPKVPPSEAATRTFHT